MRFSPLNDANRLPFEIGRVLILSFVVYGYHPGGKAREAGMVLPPPPQPCLQHPLLSQ